MRKWGRRLLFSIQFMTRYSLNIRLYLQPNDFPRMSLFFPLNGALVGLGACLFAFLGSLTNSSLLTAIFIVLGYMLLTTVFQMSGLAKSFDMFGCRDIDARKAALQSSTLGKRGIVSIALVTTIWVAALYLLLLQYNFYSLLLVLIAVGAISKISIVFASMIGKNVEGEGIGRPFLMGVTILDFLGACLLALLICVPLVGWTMTLFLTGIQILVATIITFIFRFTLHGSTQETLGCVYQIAIVLSFLLFVFFVYFNVPLSRGIAENLFV